MSVGSEEGLALTVTNRTDHASKHIVALYRLLYEAEGTRVGVDGPDPSHRVYGGAGAVRVGFTGEVEFAVADVAIPEEELWALSAGNIVRDFFINRS